VPNCYIEDVFPLAELNKYAQKGGGIGSLNAMHPYFARRPLTASRAMTLAALVDAPATATSAKTASPRLSLPWASAGPSLRNTNGTKHTNLVESERRISCCS